MLEEKSDGFELHHILYHDNKAVDALAQLKSSHKQAPSGMFMQDLVKLSIRLDQDTPAPTLGTLLGEGGLAPTP
jgi:hypothetical protein